MSSVACQSKFHSNYWQSVVIGRLINHWGYTTTNLFFILPNYRPHMDSGNSAKYIVHAICVTVPAGIGNFMVCIYHVCFKMVFLITCMISVHYIWYSSVTLSLESVQYNKWYCSNCYTVMQNTMFLLTGRKVRVLGKVTYMPLLHEL